MSYSGRRKTGKTATPKALEFHVARKGDGAPPEEEVEDISEDDGKGKEKVKDAPKRKEPDSSAKENPRPKKSLSAEIAADKTQGDQVSQNAVDLLAALQRIDDQLDSIYQADKVASADDEQVCNYIFRSEDEEALDAMLERWWEDDHRWSGAQKPQDVVTYFTRGFNEGWS